MAEAKLGWAPSRAPASLPPRAIIFKYRGRPSGEPPGTLGRPKKCCTSDFLANIFKANVWAHPCLPIRCFIHRGLKACRVAAEKYRDDTVRGPRQAQAEVVQRTTTAWKVSKQKAARDGVGGTGRAGCGGAAGYRHRRPNGSRHPHHRDSSSPTPAVGASPAHRELLGRRAAVPVSPRQPVPQSPSPSLELLPLLPQLNGSSAGTSTLRSVFSELRAWPDTLPGPTRVFTESMNE